jgi:hypothetical protein
MAAVVPKSGQSLGDSKMTNKETIEIAKKIAEAARRVEETAVNVAQKKTQRSELTTKVTESAAALSDYILTRARRVS